MTVCALSQNKRKEIRSLASAKGRNHLGVFIAEGTRCVIECLPLFSLRELYATAAWAEAHPEIQASIIEKSELERLSLQQSPQGVIAIFEIPEAGEYRPGESMTIALDAVQDPGNLGTIIRLADWFGITDILAGPGTADPFAPKVVQATMGALGRVRVHRVPDLAAELRRLAPRPRLGAGR
ncbi:MAG: RNA methyltransferase [Muribaculaceae bacterium]|nr:RNA methyltransferase [Muribaculaceae bacterium]